MANLKKIGVLRTASFMGLYGVFTGIILDIVALVISLVLSMLIGTAFSTSSMLDITGLSLGVLGFLIYPIAIGLISFFSALIFVPLVNLVLKITGGVGLKIQLGDQIY